MSIMKNPRKKFDFPANGTPYEELCRFAESCDLSVEIDKPFSEFENLFLKVTDKDKEEIGKVAIDNITYIQNASAKLLNDLSKTR
jgi:hypothetical protein